MDRIQRFAHGACVAGPAGGIFGQHARDQLGQGFRHVAAHVAQPGRILQQHLAEHCDHVGTAKGRVAGQTFEQDAAERKNIGAGVQLGRLARLLWGHVRGCAHHAARARDGLRGIDGSSQAEVEYLRSFQLSVFEDDVAGLDVAVHDTAAVGFAECIAQTARERNGVAHAQRFAADASSQSISVHPFHDQVGLGIGQESVRDVTHDARMTQLGEQAHLAGETLAVAVAHCCHDLERNRATCGCVSAAVDASHTADASAKLHFEARIDQVTAIQLRHVERAPRRPHRRDAQDTIAPPEGDTFAAC
jgi:hypothetical protein